MCGVAGILHYADADLEHAPSARTVERGEFPDERLLRLALAIDSAKERAPVFGGDATRTARLGFPVRGDLALQRGIGAGRRDVREGFENGRHTMSRSAPPSLVSLAAIARLSRRLRTAISDAHEVP